MNRLEKKLVREERNRHERDNPSFSSTLLEKIYRSMNDDDGYQKNEDLKIYRETMQKKQSKSTRRKEGEEEMSSVQRACLIEKWMEKKVSEKASAEKKQVFSEFVRNLHHDDDDHDHDVLFFSSTSNSSDSSSGGLSSSDSDSIYGTKTKASSCFAHPSWPKPVRTSVSARPEKPLKTEKKTGKTERTLFYEQRELHMFDDYHYNSASDHTPRLDESLFKSKSTAMKIYGNLKKVKQPISPGGRLASFINSLFTAGNTKRTKSSSSIISGDDERKLKSGQVSTCSSASSFSRSCLSKNSPSTREKLRNGVKRTVRFCPVSVIVDEDSRPCGQKCLYEEEDSSLLSVSVPTAWKIGKSSARKCEEETKSNIMEKSRRVEEMAREFLKEYHLNQKKNDFISSETRNCYVVEEMDEDEDDAASYSSSDLFELDHLVFVGNNRYREELPVYETTYVETNRAIANGLI